VKSRKIFKKKREKRCGSNKRSDRKNSTSFFAKTRGRAIDPGQVRKNEPIKTSTGKIYHPTWRRGAKPATLGPGKKKKKKIGLRTRCPPNHEEGERVGEYLRAGVGLRETKVKGGIP